MCLEKLHSKLYLKVQLVIKVHSSRKMTVQPQQEAIWGSPLLSTSRSLRRAAGLRGGREVRVAFSKTIRNYAL